MDSDSSENENLPANNPMFICKVYIADGFRTDCQKLIDDFLEMPTIRFELFCKLWRDHHMDEIFSYRPTVSEFAEFTEEALIITKDFMVSPRNSFKEAVGGLYLSYTVYQLQPIEKFGRIPITADEAASIVKLRDTARSEKHYDVLYILGKLLCSGAIQFSLESYAYGLEREYRKAFQEKMCMDEIPTRKGVMSKNGQEFATLREISALTRRYVRVKAQIHNTAQPDQSLRYTNEHLSNELAASLDSLLKKGVWKISQEADDMLLDSRLNIRQRAMTSAITHPLKRQKAPVLLPTKTKKISPSKKSEDKSEGTSLTDKIDHILSEEERQLDLEEF